MSLLSKVGKESPLIPPRVVIYGAEKIGKSTFCSEAPSPIALDVEGGFEYIEIPRYKPNDLQEVFDFVEELSETDHGYETLVIDSADWLERLIQNTVAAEDNKKNVADVPYGAGYKRASGIFGQLLASLDSLREKKAMAIIFTAHEQVKRFDDPVNESYDRHQLKLHEQVMSLIQEWSDCILFATAKVYVTSKEKRFNKEITKAKGGGERIIKCIGHPAYVAGNRLGLPEELPLVWAAFQESVLTIRKKGKDNE